MNTLGSRFKSVKPTGRINPAGNPQEQPFPNALSRNELSAINMRSGIL
ncbi:MAG: hypothetical protein AAGE96_07175 [Cyanobacteria bacterium P01_G01_bin.19]